jgi:type II secretory pathway pseudopilin PulG
MATETNGGGSILKSRKAQIVVIGIVAVLGISLGGAALGMTDEQKTQAIDALKWLIGLLLGGHTLTDIAHSITGARERTAVEQENGATERARLANGGGTTAPSEPAEGDDETEEGGES